MNVAIRLDHSIGIRGRLVVEWFASNGKLIDREVIFKHPRWLRVRLWLATKRMERRQRKIETFLRNHPPGL